MVTGLAVNVLGPVEVRRGGALLTVEGLKRRQLLAVLVAARGSEVSAGAIGRGAVGGRIAGVGSGEPAEPRLTAAARARPDQVVRAGGVGYAIDMGLVDLDAARFEELAHAATGPERIPRSNAPSASGAAPRSASSPSSLACAARRCAWRNCG